MNKKITLDLVGKTSLFSFLLIAMLSLQTFSQVDLQATVTNETCFGDSNGNVVLNPTNGTAPYTFGEFFNDNFSGGITFGNYVGTAITTSDTNSELSLIPVSASDSWESAFVSNQTFTREAGLTFEGSVYIPDSDYKAIMIGFNDGLNSGEGSVQHGLYFFDNGGDTDVTARWSVGASAINGGTSYTNNNGQGHWLDFKIVLNAQAGATYSVKREGEANYTNTHTANVGSLATFKIGVQANVGSGGVVTSNTLHKNWRVYKTATATTNLSPGSYTYNVTDANGSYDSLTVTVASDTEAPTITITNGAIVAHEAKTAYVDSGAVANDNCSATLTNTVNNVPASPNLGQYTVDYTATDTAGNSVTSSRTVNVVDTTLPIISLNSSGVLTMAVGTVYSELGATAADNYDGDISANIVVDDSNVNASVVGVYSVTYNVNDSSSNSATEVTRTVNVVDTTDPIAIANAGPIVINLNGTTTITAQDVDNGSSDNYVAGGISLSIDKSSFNCNDLGNNTVTLTVTDSSNNTSTTTIIVSVIDDVEPLNVMLINPAYVHPTGTGYVEQGFMYDEECLNRTEIISSDLDVNQWGTYTIVYKLVDDSGNESATITRTQVVNNTPTTNAANFTVNQDTNNHLFDVLDGDSFGPDGYKSFVISGNRSTQNGTLVLNNNNTPLDPTDDTVTYSPRATYNGPDSFTYTIEDENGDSVTTTVNIVVRPIVPTAVNDDVAVVKNSSNNIISVLSNDDFGGNGTHSGHSLTFTNGSNSSASANGGVITVSGGNILYSTPNDFIGVDSFDYTITDGDGDADTATVTVTVSTATDTPSAEADIVTVNQDSTGNLINVLDNDDFGTDGAAANPLIVTGSSALGGTTAVVNGEVSYDPAANFVGIDTFEYTIEDSNGDTSIATVTVTVTEVVLVNGVPTAENDAVTVNAGQMTVINVLADNGNGADSFGTDGAIDNGLTMTNGTITSASLKGSLISVDRNGTATTLDDVFNYTPSALAIADETDAFSYTITDASGDASTATVTVTVVAITDIPSAIADVATVNQDSTGNLIDVLDNDDYGTDGAAANPLTVTGSSTLGGTTAVVNGEVSYDPAANFVGIDTFEYTIEDSNGDTSTATVTVTVEEIVVVNGVPTAVADTVIVAVDSSDNIIDVADNDNFGTDGEHGLHPITLTNGKLSTVSNNGGAINVVNGNVNYTPPAGFNGSDSFDYTITDGNGDADTATVTITVGALPTVAIDDSFSIDVDVATNLDVLANDLPGATIISHDAVSLEGHAISGTTSLLTYTPTGGFTGTDSFNYVISGGSIATVTLTVGVVLPVNPAPTAQNDAVTVNAGQLTVINVLADNGNGADSFGTDGAIDNGLTMTNGTITSASLKGSLISVDRNGTATTLDDVFNYTPSALAMSDGTDTFSYTITDATGDASTGTVTVTIAAITDAPSAIADAATVNQDTTGNLIDVLDNDDYGTDGAAAANSLAVTGTSALGGTTTVVNGEVSYDPAANFVGIDTFEYTIEDSNGDKSTATVTVTVEEVVVVNGTPTAVDDTITVFTGSSDNIIDVTDNDNFGSDNEHGNHPITMPNGSLSSASAHGGAISVGDNNTVNDLTDDVILYSAPAGFTGVDTFDYTITDGNGDASTATVTVTVNAVTDAPSAVADTATVSQNTTGNLIDVLVNDDYGTDGAAANPLTVNGSSALGGTTAVVNGEVSYDPAANFVGIDTFEYTIEDSNGDTSTATVTVTVTEVVLVNGMPTAENDVVTVNAGQMTVINVLADNGNGVDSFGTDGAIDNGLTMTNGTILSASLKGSSISVDRNGTSATLDDVFNYTPSALAIADGTDTFSYTITDASGDASTATVTVTVNPAPALGFTPDSFIVNQNSTDNEFDVMANDTDDAGFAPTDVRFLIESVDHLTGTTEYGGTVTLNTNGTANDTSDDVINYTPAVNFIGTDTFNYVPGNDRNTLVQVTVTVEEVIVVNGTPTAVADFTSVTEGTNNNIIDVTDNDNFGTDGEHSNHPLTLSNGRVSTVSNNGGAITVSGGNVLYSAPAGFTGTDSFDYTITDGNGDAATATVTITVAALKSLSVGTSGIKVFENEFLAYPNPTKGYLKSTLLSSISTKATVSIFDITGKVVYSSNLELNKGKNEFELNLNLKAGIMFIKITSPEVNFGTSKILFK
ncbi:Ig-like domain-containing protein [Polaribacter ponticola]|uniref:Ig-like domain-containing protein n=1 Tax=Polaribacter ponticola TaxID=2978475 RepID=A0ABT5SDG4_9FLAO|nr:Ig-like domain-containing protein [Polaribacter sp. MSW5]MDD7915889.1 Ig-like domain-containing protein [Polaribacter sp. MSW5]